MYNRSMRILLLNIVTLIGFVSSCSKDNKLVEFKDEIQEEESIMLEFGVKNESFKKEEVPEAVVTKIRSEMIPFSEIKEYPKGFNAIEDVKFTWLNIAGSHTRCAISGDLFLFPRLDVAKEDNKWSSGIALRKNSNIAYKWSFSDHE